MISSNALMKLTLRKGLVFTGITVFIIASFLVLTYGIYYLLRASWSTPIGLTVIIGTAVVMAFLFNPVKTALEKGVDRLFYGDRYHYRKMVLNFADHMTDILDIEELARAMLRPITSAVGASQASLLFAGDSHYTARFAERLEKDAPVIPVEFRREGPIVTWLKEEDKPLNRTTIDNDLRFQGLGQDERNILADAEIELLCPVRNKGELIAILALSRKQPRGGYSRDDMDMLMTLAGEAAVAIENARLYEHAKQRANTDELTGLYNHRYFHERMDEEIARCSRFGDIFSLLFMDLDLFKKYNDIYGHLAGDEVLKQVGQQINESTRSIDISFRYGGDEFAILLPGAPLEGAVHVGDKLRRGIESRTDWKELPVTCSIGIASWPTDGVMREDLIQAADAALYYSKQAGRNHTSLACEAVLSDVLRRDTGFEPQNKDTIRSTIFALADTVDAKDHYTYGHSQKVSKYAVDIAEALGYSPEGIERIRAGALLHDIGKIGISDHLLTKREPLTADDWELMHAHSSLGVAILRHVDNLKDCLAVVQYHHERYDGTGYPAGLKGENIPLDARIMAVADSYDAITSQRPYRRGSSTHDEAVKELRRFAGIQFDPDVVEAFVNLHNQSPQALPGPEEKIDDQQPFSIFPADWNI